MKPVINCAALLLLFSLIGMNVQAQKPEKIYSFVKVMKPQSYYLEQAELWHKEIIKNDKDANAWLNYYVASRNISRSSADTSAKWYTEHWKMLNKIAEDMGKAVPNSFEYNLVKYRQGGLDLSLFPYLKKAYELAPERPETWEELATYYEVTGDIKERDKFLKLMYNAGEFSQGMLHYNYNVLAGLDKDAVLMTCGDNDTYPVWALQAVTGFRKDVIQLNTSLLALEPYRNRIFAQLGLPKVKLSDSLSEKEYDAFGAGLIKNLIKNKVHRPVYVALTAIGGQEAYKDSLYLTGLAYRYSGERMDNNAILKKNFEQNYMLDNLSVHFGSDRSEGIVRILNENYLVPLITLYDHYKLSGEYEKASRMKALALTVVKDMPEEAEVKKYFEKK